MGIIRINLSIFEEKLYVHSPLFSIALICLASSLLPVHADDYPHRTKRSKVWQLLDYIAVDYHKSVKDGAVVNQVEYTEMQEFAYTAERQLTEMPTSQALPGLIKDAATLPCVR